MEPRDIALGISFALNVYNEIRAHRLRRNSKSAWEVNSGLAHRLATAARLNTYLVNMVERGDPAVSEFDAIVLNNMLIDLKGD